MTDMIEDVRSNMIQPFKYIQIHPTMEIQDEIFIWISMLKQTCGHGDFSIFNMRMLPFCPETWGQSNVAGKSSINVGL